MPPDAIRIPSSQVVDSVGYNQAPTANGNDQIAHVLFLDVVGFTKLRPAKQRSVLGKLQDIVRETRDFCAAKTTKELIALPTGDGMALVFLTTIGGSGAAISCAEKVAEAVLKYNEITNEEDAKINVRMGIHSGNVVRISDVNDHENVAGEGINTAQRVMDCGDIGHILLSDVAFRLRPADPDRTDYCLPLGNVKVKHDQEVNLYSLYHDQIGNQKTPEKILSEKKDEELRLEKLRRAIQKEKEIELQKVKEMLREAARIQRRKWIIGICSVLTLLVLTVLISRAIQKPNSPASLAVLPFQPQTQKKYSSRAISKGLTDQFIRSFRDLTNVEPRPLSSVNALNQNPAGQTEPSRPLSPLEMGRKLNVRYVLTGTVESYNDDANLIELSDVNPNFDVAIHAELYDTEVGKRIWNRSYTSKPFNKLIELQKTIVQEVADKMEVPLRATVASDDYANVASANWYYLLGRFWSTRPETQPGQDVVVKAIESYKKAIDIDPHFALAHAGVADMYSSYSGASMDPKKAKDEAVKAAEDAQNWGEKLGLPEVYCSIGTEKWWLERNFGTARIALVLAITLNPQFADSHKRYSSYLAAVGQHDLAEIQVHQAINIEPESAFMRFAAGQNYFFANKYDKAIKQLRDALSIKSNLWDAYRFLAMALEQQKTSKQEALNELEKVPEEIRKKDSDFLAAYAHILARFDETGEALKIAKELENLKKETKSKENRGYVSPYNIAVSYAAIPGKEEDTLRWIDTAIREFDPRVTWLKVDPRFNELRKSKKPEFNRRLQAAGLPL